MIYRDTASKLRSLGEYRLAAVTEIAALIYLGELVNLPSIEFEKIKIE